MENENAAQMARNYKLKNDSATGIDQKMKKVRV